MLSDFLLLEEYYETPQTAMFYEDLSRRYGAESLCKAIEAGYLVCKKVKCAQQRKIMFWLSESGRLKARGENLNLHLSAK